MTTISPLRSQMLANTINMQSNNQEKIYQDLTKHANDVKPNDPKAKIIEENPLQAAASAVKDTFQDGKNFFTAAKTGKMNDNSLGRINDLGMKFGALLIATFLASHSKTKTNAIMQFVGAGTFFSVMSLWPKLFINLPARLVHGFRIDERYISAQGDKKDLYLDNQFIPTDALSKDKLRKEAQRSGIDYDSENGEEKILRKRQKTALQNRTLWMATAGFATPLLTALIGDKIEPLVKEGVIQHGFKKSKKSLENLDKVLNASNPIVKNHVELEKLFSEYSTNLDKEGLGKISAALNIDFSDIFKDADDKKVIKDLKFNVNPITLETLRKQTSIIQEENLEKLLKDAFAPISEQGAQAAQTSRLKGILGNYNAKPVAASTTFSSEKIEEAVKQFKELKEGKTYEKLSQMLKETFGAEANSDMAQKIDLKLNKVDFKFNDTPFFEILKQFNNDVLGSIRGKLKTYLDILNPVVGSKDESVYTKIYRDNMKKIIDKAGFSIEELKLIEKAPSTTSGPESIEVLSNFFKQFATLPEEQYVEELKSLIIKGNDKELKDFVAKISDKNNLSKITQLQGSADKPVFADMCFGLEDKIIKNINHFTNVANPNISNIKSRALIVANLERQIANNGFENALKAKGLVTDSMPIGEWIKKARLLVYEGTVAADACKVELSNSSFTSLKEVIFNKDNYSAEIKLMPDVSNILEGMKNLGTTAKDNSIVTGLGGLLRTTAKEILNNKAWKKIFVPMSLVLIAVTLLVQPFFGNIKDEYPENKTKGAK